MDVTLSTEDARRAFAIAGAVCAKQGAKAAPNWSKRVLVDARDGGLFVRGTDLLLTASVRVDARVSKPGLHAVPGNVAALIGKMPAKTVRLRVWRNAWVRVESGKSRAQVARVPGEEQPDVKPIEGESVELALAELAPMLARVLVATDPKHTLYRGVLFSSEGGKLVLAGTDQYRLVEARTDIVCELPGRVLVPIPLVRMVQRYAGKADGSVRLAFASGDSEGEFAAVSFRFADGVELSGAIPAIKFPGYAALLPTGFDFAVRVQRRELADAIKRAAMYEQVPVGHTRLEPGRRLLRVSSRDETGEVVTEIAAEFGRGTTDCRKPYPLTFQGRFVADWLKSIAASEDVDLRFTGPERPAEFVDHEERGIRCVVMPINN